MRRCSDERIYTSPPSQWTMIKGQRFQIVKQFFFFQQQHLDLWQTSLPVVCCSFGIASRSATWLSFWWPGQATPLPSCPLTHSGKLTYSHQAGNEFLQSCREDHCIEMLLSEGSTSWSRRDELRLFGNVSEKLARDDQSRSSNLVSQVQLVFQVSFCYAVKLTLKMARHYNSFFVNEGDKEATCL